MAQSGLVYIDGNDWAKWKAEMERLKGTFGLASDKTLAYIGTEGRRLIGAKEKQNQFHFGAAQTKWKENKGGYVKAVRSRWDSTHGWYKTSIGTRMIGFSFENALSYQKRKMGRLNDTMSQGYVYSLMANLWNNPTKPYAKNSPRFRREGFMHNGKPRMGGWGIGSSRPARPALSVGLVNAGVNRAIARAEVDLQRLINEGGL